MEGKTLLVPVYGFQSMEEAQEYQKRANRHCLSGHRVHIFYNVAHAKYYVPVAGVDCKIDANALQDLPPQGITMWYKLRDRSEPRPEGGYLALMLVPGKREYTRKCNDKLLSVWVRRLSTGKRDCFAAWLRSDGLDHHLLQLSVDGAVMQAHVVRGARGVVFSRVPILSSGGHIEEFVRNALFVQATILDKHPDKDDMLRINIAGNSALDFPESNGTLRAPEHDPVWQKLIQRATAGFSRQCVLWPTELENRRRFMMAQLANARADGRCAPGKGFAEIVRSLDWEDALRLVEEPWQMEIVCRVYGDRRMHHGINGARLPTEVIGALIDKLGIGLSNADELRRMISDYVSFITDQEVHGQTR